MLSLSVSAVDLVMVIAVLVLVALYITDQRARVFEPDEVSPARRLFPNLPSLFLVAFGLIILVWVGWLTWYDVSTWGKDIASVFFGSRAGEAISLGIGMKVFDYFLISLALPLSGLLVRAWQEKWLGRRTTSQ